MNSYNFALAVLLFISLPMSYMPFNHALHAGLLINEIACATPGSDWVELFYSSEEREKINISHLYVTMYYGTNEHLSDEPISIYSYDRPETSCDDRFIVVHLTDGGKDETDLTGDSNRNGRIDVYCDNYSNSLWNSDCVVAIDTDDDPSNGGMLDFVAYSTNDGSINENIENYFEYARTFMQWQNCQEDNPQKCMIFTGNNGLSSYSSISRISPVDTNTSADFIVTKYTSPGKTNILINNPGRKKLFRVIKKKTSITPTHLKSGKTGIKIFIYESCNIRFRVFSDIGLKVYESPLYRDMLPGFCTLPWEFTKTNTTGLYIGYIEATARALKKSESEKIYIILSHYNK